MVQKVQHVGAVVHVVDSLLRNEYQPEEGAGGGRRAARLKLRVRHLLPAGADLGDEAVTAVDGEYFPARGHDQPQWRVEGAAGRERVSHPGRMGPSEGVV